MLQQTQVERVIPFYKNFIREFPTAKKLAEASLTDVLKAWQGLGYNRRAKMLHLAAAELAAKKPTTIPELEELPGVGPYTACAVAAFAWSMDSIFIETNIRTVIIHHFFPNKRNISDIQIESVLAQVFPKGRAREWYSALMDYGAYLKRSGISHNARSKTYAKQSKFAGSLREARGALVRAYTKGETVRGRLLSLLGTPRRAQMKKALGALIKEGLINESLLSKGSRLRQQPR
jgi:A/G-specific adenine glycosylase